MKIKQLGPRRVCVALSRDDLNEAGLTYEDIGVDGAQTHTLLNLLLKLVGRSVEFSSSGRVFVDICSDGEGGCLVWLSEDGPLPQNRWRVVQRTSRPVIYAFDDIDTLIAGASKLFQRCSHRLQKSTLYRIGDGWRLAIFPADMGKDSKTLALLDEYARRCGQGPLALAWLDEHSQVLLRDNAVDLLSSYFG